MSLNDLAVDGTLNTTNQHNTLKHLLNIVNDTSLLDT